MNTGTAPMFFDDVVGSLDTLPACTFRFDGLACRHRAKWYVHKRPCCYDGGVDFMCDTCHFRINWYLAMGVQFECTGCGTRSATFAAMYPVAGRL